MSTAFMYAHAFRVGNTRGEVRDPSPSSYRLALRLGCMRSLTAVVAHAVVLVTVKILVYVDSSLAVRTD